MISIIPDIKDSDKVIDLAIKDFRTTGVLKKFGISYQNDANLSVEMACQHLHLDKEVFKKEIIKTSEVSHILSAIDYNSWQLDFMMDFIQNINHQSLRNQLLEIEKRLTDFFSINPEEAVFLESFHPFFLQLKKVFLKEMDDEEQNMFPYIRQLIYANKHKEPYAALFVRTLGKPISPNSFEIHEAILTTFFSIYELTNQYQLNSNYSENINFIIQRIESIHSDTLFHFYLESQILFPKAKSIESDLLKTN